MKDIDELKKQFVFREVWMSSWNASVQRASLYKSGARKNRLGEIDIFKKNLISFVQNEIIPKYRVKVNE